MRMKLNNFLVGLTGLFLVSITLPPAFAQNATKDYTKESAAERDARMAWFREARFGMFIHWGVYSVPAGEWKGKTNYAEWFLEQTKMPVLRVRKVSPSSSIR